MKKNLLWMLIFIFAFLQGGERTYASSANVELKNEGRVVVGDKFEVTLEVDSDDSLSGLETYISYDEELAEFLSADDGIAGGKGLLRVNIKSVGDVKGKLKYKIKFLARKSGVFTMAFSDEIHLYAADTDDEISVASGDLEMRIMNKREASSDSSLANLKVAGGKLVPQFSKSVLDYTVNVGEDVDNITIGVDTSDANSGYSFIRDYSDKLRTGKNKIEIVVKAEDGSKTTYTITVIKAETAENEQEEVSGTGVKQIENKSSETLETTGESIMSETPEYVPDPPKEDIAQETDIEDSKHPVMYAIIGAVVILGIMLVLGMILYRKNKNKDKNED